MFCMLMQWLALIGVDTDHHVAWAFGGNCSIGRQASNLAPGFHTVLFATTFHVHWWQHWFHINLYAFARSQVISDCNHAETLAPVEAHRLGERNEKLSNSRCHLNLTAEQHGSLWHSYASNRGSRSLSSILSCRPESHCFLRERKMKVSTMCRAVSGLS